MSLLFIKKSSISIQCNKALFYFLIFWGAQLFVVATAMEVTKVPTTSLGQFKANFSQVKKTKLMKSQSLIGQVSYMAGENYTITLPFDVQRIHYQVKNGSEVSQGETIAIVEGYDVHHFIDEYKSAKVLLAIQKKHFQTNKQYFNNKTIKSSQWIEITKSYYEAKLNFEHIQHQMSFLHIDENEQISLISPKSGVIQIPSSSGRKTFGELAFSIIDISAIKVKVIVPLLLADNLLHFNVNSTCKLNVSSVEKVVDKFHQILWAEASSEQCELLLGQSIRVIPIKKITGYKIAKSAVFEFENNNYIAIKADDALALIPVSLMGATQGEFIFTTKNPIDDEQVLISSVSILQGSLFSLGGE